LQRQVEADSKSATGSCSSRITETQQALHTVRAEHAGLLQQIAAANSARAQLQEQVVAAASAGQSLKHSPFSVLSHSLSAAAQRAAVEDSRITACAHRVDVLERAAAAAASSSTATNDAWLARFAATERSIDALRLEQQQVIFGRFCPAVARDVRCCSISSSCSSC
jgi:chromosome segregation ATPase